MVFQTAQHACNPHLHHTGPSDLFTLGPHQTPYHKSSPKISFTNLSEHYALILEPRVNLEQLATYDKCFYKWFKYSSQRVADPNSPSTMVVANFFAQLIDKNLKNTVQGFRKILRTVISDTIKDFVNSPLIDAVIATIDKKIIPYPNYQLIRKSWNTDKVFHYLHSIPHFNNLSPIQLLFMVINRLSYTAFLSNQ